MFAVSVDCISANFCGSETAAFQNKSSRVTLYTSSANAGAIAASLVPAPLTPLICSISIAASPYDSVLCRREAIDILCEVFLISSRSEISITLNFLVPSGANSPMSYKNIANGSFVGRGIAELIRANSGTAPLSAPLASVKSLALVTSSTFSKVGAPSLATRASIAA